MQSEFHIGLFSAKTPIRRRYWSAGKFMGFDWLKGLRLVIHRLAVFVQCDLLTEKKLPLSPFHA